uniref:Superoxide dismutase copper/zinc binding domain-containing protein n=1 Tax=Sarcophilus harrisii TaxID=9305 RepID=A0A7N4V4J3_SARHA
SVCVCVCVWVGGWVDDTVFFEQKQAGEPMELLGSTKGLAKGNHRFHIHEFGNNPQGYNSAGSHFNPLSKKHSGTNDKEKQCGDLGKVTPYKDGVATMSVKDSLIQLSEPISVKGHTIVVHEKADNLGKGGNIESEKSLSYGIIGITK